MRVVYYTPSADGSGGFYRAFFLARNLAAAGHECVLLCGALRRGWRAGSRVQDGVTVRALARQTRLPLIMAADALRAIGNAAGLARQPPDVVHALTLTIPSSALTLAAARARRRVLAVADWEDWWGRGGIWADYPWWLRWPGTALEEWPVTLAHRVTVVSDALRDRALALGVPAERIRWIPNGANVDAIPVMERDEARAALGLSRGDEWIVHVGFTHASAFALLLGAMRSVAEERPDARLALVGRLPPAFERMVAEEGLADRVRFVGPAAYPEGVATWLGAADVLALSMRDSIIEAARWPIRLGDYLAAGRPIVATDLGEVAKAVRACDCGILTPPGDGAAFGEALRRLLADEGERERLGRNGRRAAETIYAWRRIAAQVDELYRKATP